jgi:hypothetical protein
MKRTNDALVVIPQQALSVQMIDQGDGRLRILCVSDKLPWNLSHGPSLLVLVDLLYESALPNKPLKLTAAGIGRAGSRARHEPWPHHARPQLSGQPLGAPRFMRMTEPKLTCPHCGKPAMTAWRKIWLGPLLHAHCTSCHRPVGVSWWAMLTIVPFVICALLAIGPIGFATVAKFFVGIAAMFYAHLCWVPLTQE